MRKDWAGPLLFTLFLFAAAEAGLRVVGFEYSFAPIGMRYAATLAHMGAEQRAHRKNFRIEYGLDRELLWRPLNTPGVTNSQGFLGPEWTSSKDPGTVRIVTLGDSCTVAGIEPYPGKLRDMLKDSPRYQVWNAGVGSWSSYQGRKLLETRLVHYSPDVVTIYFGWNDHWMAWAAPDKELSALLDRQMKTLYWVQKSRLLQAMLRVIGSQRGLPDFTQDTPPRVSLEDYGSNLEAMVALVRKGGGRAVLLTAPSGLTPDHPTTVNLTTETHNFFDRERIGEVHSSYNERVRDVARRTHTPLIDLAAEFEKHDSPPSLFSDGIHLSPKGHALVAGRVWDVIKPLK